MGRILTREEFAVVAQKICADTNREILMGTQLRSEQARHARQCKRQEYKRSGRYKHKTGTRFLTDREVRQWHARLEQIMGPRMKVS